MLLDKRPAVLEPTNDLISFGQMIDFVSAGGMRLDGKDLAVHPKAADAIFRTILKSRKQSVGILQAETAQLRQCVWPFHLTNGGSGRRDELDGLISKHATKAKSNHGLPQFIVVMLSCSTVASDTQTKYGI